MSGFCIQCGTRFESFDGLDCCPACGTQSIPCSDDNQVTISVNLQELRVLVMWAENWQRERNLGRTVYAIARRIRAQYSQDIPLTLADGLGEIASLHNVSVSDPALRRDIAEQTGEETGLFNKPPVDEPPYYGGTYDPEGSE